MRASANRTQDNESRAVANNVSCKREERQAVQFVDNSPHTKSIAQLQAMMDKSMNPHQVQMRKLLAIINNSPQRKTPVLPGVTQKKGPLDEEELQFKSKEAVQKKGPLDEEELQFKKDETVQCKGKGFGDEEELQFKSKEAVQKKGPLDEDELQFKKDEAVQCKGPLDEEELQFKAEEPVQQQENKTGLPDDLKAGVENLSGMAMDDVRVHYNSGKPAQLNAYAYTQGSEIHVAPGQEKHLPHEAWHVVQQKQGRVQPTREVGGMPLNDSRTLEAEADSMPFKVIQEMANNSPQVESSARLSEVDNNPREIVQRVVFFCKNKWHSDILPDRVFSSQKEAQAAEKFQRQINVTPFPMHFGKGTPYHFPAFPSIEEIPSEQVTRVQEQVEMLRPMMEVLKPENYRFSTSDPGREPTHYYREIGMSDGKRTVLHSGRVRQEHDDGPRVYLDESGRRDRFSHNKELLDVVDQYEAEDRRISHVDLRRATPGMHHIEIENKPRHKRFYNAHPSGGTLAYPNVNSMSLDEATLKAAISSKGSVEDRRRHLRKYRHRPY